MKKKLLLALVALVGLTGTMRAQQAYATLSADSTVLTFRYDTQKATRTEAVYELTTEMYPSWPRQKLVTVDFDASFANYTGVTCMTNWFCMAGNLTEVRHLERLNTSNVTNMGNLFFSCPRLTSLNLSNFNTSKVTVMGGMFFNCVGLTSLDLSSFDTSKVWNLSRMFHDCIRLQSLDLSSFDFSSAIHVSQMFTNCSSLTSLNLPATTNPHLDQAWSMFEGCSSLTTLDLSHFDASKATDMGSMFKDCSSLRTINLSNFDTSNNTGFRAMFAGCSSLWSLNLSSFDTSKARNMHSMFDGCSSLQSLDLSNFDLSSVNHNYGLMAMFRNCTSLTSVTLFGTPYASPDNHIHSMFEGCTSLTTVDLSGLGSHKYWDAEELFKGCTSLTDIIFPQPVIIKSAYRMFCDCTSLQTLDFSSFVVNEADTCSTGYMLDGCTSLTTIYCDSVWTAFFSTEMFRNCTSLVGAVPYDPNNLNNIKYANPYSGYFTFTNAPDSAAYAILGTDSTFTFYYGKIPASADGLYRVYTAGACSWENVKDSIKVVMFDSSFANWQPLEINQWFRNCRNLVSIERIGNLNTSKVTNMSSMFYGCSALRGLNLGILNTINVSDMRSMFDGCRALTSLDLSSFDTSKVTSMGRMFYECYKLTSLDLSGFDTSKVTGMGDMFRHCASLTSLDLSSFDTSKVTYMGNMFYNCNSLTSLDLSSFNTSNVTNMGRMFNECSALTTLDLSGFNTSNVTDMNYMFYRCRALTSLDLSSFDTGNVTNMQYMFCDCVSLTTLDLRNFTANNAPQATEMFYNCTKLVTIYCNNTWTWSDMSKSSLMFRSCLSLVGAISFEYNKVGGIYANPETGYFTYSPVDLWVNGFQVTGKNKDDIGNLLNLGQGRISYDYTTNTLTMNNATVTKPNGLVDKVVGLESNIDGLTIKLVGTNLINMTDTTAIVLRKNTTIMGTGTLTAQSSSHNGIYIYGGTLSVTGGATLNAVASSAPATIKSGFGIYGRTTSRLDPRGGTIITYLGSLAIDGYNTKVQGIGSMASVAMLNTLTYPTGSTLKVVDPTTLREANGYFYDHNVCTRSSSGLSGYTYTPATALVRISAPTIQQGDVNEDGFVNEQDITDLALMLVGNKTVTATADVNGSGTVSLSDLTTLVTLLRTK